MTAKKRRLNAEIIVDSILNDTAEDEQHDVTAWTKEAPPTEVTKMLQRLAGQLSDQIAAADVGLSQNAYNYAKADFETLKSCIRRRLPGLALLINSDLAISARTLHDGMSAEQHDRLLKLRMEALAAEILQHLKPVKLVELSVFPRAAVTDVNRRAASVLDVAHCVGARVAFDSQAKANAAMADYRDALQLYMEREGTSIALEGHIGSGTIFETLQYSDDYEPTDQVWVSQRKSLKISAPAGKLGSYDAYLSEVAFPLLGLVAGKDSDHTGGVVHLMEGVDLDFLPETRRGTVAHMFLVLSDAEAVGSVREATVELKQMLLRLCGFQTAARAEVETGVARKRQRQIERQAREALQERNALREASRNVDTIARSLQATVSTLFSLIEEHYYVAQLNKWLGAMVPLIKTDEPVELPYCAPVTGNHNAWERTHLAAAFWLFAQPDMSRHAIDPSAPADKAWALLHASLEREEIRANEALNLLHRLDSTFETPRRIPPLLLDQCFAKFKSWVKTHEKSASARSAEEGDESSRTRYAISELLFLLGDISFADIADAGDQADRRLSRREKYWLPLPDEADFDFLSPAMVDGLARFAAVLDTSVDTLADAGAESGSAGADGVVAVQIGLVGPDDAEGRYTLEETAGLATLADDAALVEHAALAALKAETEAFTDWLYVGVRQSEAAFLAGTKAQAAAGGGRARKGRRRNLGDDQDRKLRDQAKGLSVLLQRTAEMSFHHVGGAEGDEQKWRAVHRRSGSGETSRAIAKALGLANTFPGPDGGDHTYASSEFLELKMPESDVGLPVLVIRGGGERAIALLAADPATNTFEFLFAPGVRDDARAEV